MRVITPRIRKAIPTIVRTTSGSMRGALMDGPLDDRRRLELPPRGPPGARRAPTSGHEA